MTPISSWVRPIQTCSPVSFMLARKVISPPYLSASTTSSSFPIISYMPPIQKPASPINSSISHLSSGFKVYTRTMARIPTAKMIRWARK